MMFLRTLALLALLGGTAFSGETQVGWSYQLTGTVENVFVKDAGVFLVRVKDADGTARWVWMDDNNQALATVLGQKASGGSTRIIYQQMALSHDNAGNCYDIPFQEWVCLKLHWVEAR